MSSNRTKNTNRNTTHEETNAVYHALLAKCHEGWLRRGSVAEVANHFRVLKSTT